MQIDNIEESKILLLEIEQLFIELDDIKKELESKIDLKGAEQFKIDQEQYKTKYLGRWI